MIWKGRNYTYINGMRPSCRYVSVCAHVLPYLSLKCAVLYYISSMRRMCTWHPCPSASSTLYGHQSHHAVMQATCATSSTYDMIAAGRGISRAFSARVKFVELRLYMIYLLLIILLLSHRPSWASISAMSR